MTDRLPSAVIENITPVVDGGKYPVKRIVGEDLTVSADVFKDGHDVVSAVLKWRKQGGRKWNETPMTPLINDRWTATCSFYENAFYEFTIEAWGDVYRTWQHEYHAKFKGGLTELTSEMLEGAAFIEAAAARATKARVTDDAKRLKEIAKKIRKLDIAEVYDISNWSELAGLMDAWPDREISAEYLPYLPVRVDRERAGFASWYEFFPRSAEGKADSGSKFRDCLPRIDDAKAMGFDVIYFPPIHPIGTSNRKGRNNSTTCEPGEPGVPYAIGNRHQKCPNGGGHKDVAPELGTLADFKWLVGEIKKRDMDIALDFAINSSPDHPYVKDHPEWFYKRPDGTIKYAENPPKKYEDVYPVNFHNDNWKALWEEMTDIVMFWSKLGVRIFRVDNPHTKPVAFWEFLIGKVHAQFPDVIFLSEAFTRPKMMAALAKVGFCQSYTYFTWRNSKHELTEYFTELTQSELGEFFRGNLWPNTPDINPFFTQTGGRPSFMIRGMLAATLSPIWGMYSGFELCEADAVPGKEEYLDSEKYQFKGRDWNAPGNIKDFITKVNHIRHANRALHEYRNLRFHVAENEQVLCYSRTTAAQDNCLLFVANLDPFHPHHCYVHVPLEEFGLKHDETYQVHDLISDERYLWTGSRNYVELTPDTKPCHIFRIRRWASSEKNFDYFL